MPSYRISRYSASTDIPSARAIDPLHRVSADWPREIEGTDSLGQKEKPAGAPLGAGQDRFTFEPQTAPAFLEPYERLRTQWTPYEQQMLTAHPLRILIGYEDAFSERALALGFAFARRYHAETLVAHIGQETDMLGPIRNVLKGQPENAYFTSYPPQTVRKAAEKASAGLVSLAGERRASLIVLATHGRTGENALRHGSVAEEVLKDAPCPVLIGHESVAVFHPGVIVVPIDGSPFSYKAIAHGILLSQDFGAHLYLFHTRAGNEADDGRSLKESLSRMQWRSVDHELVIEGGDVATGLADFCATHRADLVVMGAHRVDYDRHTYANSLTSQVVQRSPCPVLIVHPEG